MKKLILILGIFILLLLVAIFSLALFYPENPPASSTSSSTSTFFPSSNYSKTSQTQKQGASGTTNLEVSKKDGSPLVVNNFLDNGTTIKNPENPNQYYLAGSVGFCLKNGECPSGATSTDYSIGYYPQSSTFIISLQKEPLAQSRQEAEEFLMKALGITQDQMCLLNYYVLTTNSVNGIYSGENLGFSFCPGAVQLPQ